jgi:putative phosphoribosyl transferase
VWERWFGWGSRPAGPGADQLPFRDRETAAALLAERLRILDLPAGTLVLGIPRGGVPVAAVVARALGLELDVLVAHKLGAPGNPEFAIGAVAVDGTTFLESWAADSGADSGYTGSERDHQLERARRLEERLRGDRAPLAMAGRPVVIVDDGIATGSTVHVAAMAARAAGASRVVIAAPVAAAETMARLATVADETLALATPDPFYAVGLWYERFDQVEDDEVARLLSEAGGRGDPGDDPGGRAPGIAAE